MQSKSVVYLSQNKMLMIELFEHPVELEKFQQAISKGKILDIDISIHREKRSIEANAYFWVILQKLAEVLNTSKDELYLLMLERYGQFTHILVRSDVADEFMKSFKVCRELGEMFVNGEMVTQIQCYKGSSEYNTQEMSVLITGVISECKELDIEVKPQEEIDAMVKAWEAK